jgi:hypothetical protein
MKLLARKESEWEYILRFDGPKATIGGIKCKLESSLTYSRLIPIDGNKNRYFEVSDQLFWIRFMEPLENGELPEWLEIEGNMKEVVR